MAFVGRDKGLYLYWAEPVPAGSKNNTLQATDEPISKAVGTSVMIYFRKGSKNTVLAVKERSDKNVRETNLQTLRSVKKEEELLQAPEWKFFCNPWRRPGCSPAAHEADIHMAAHGGPRNTMSGSVQKEAAAHGEPTQEQASGRNCSPWRGAYGGANCLTGITDYEGPILEQSLPERLYPWEEHILEQLMKDYVLWERPRAGAGEKYEEEGQAKRKCHGLVTTTHFSCLPVLLGKGGCRIVVNGVKLNLGRKGQ